MHFLSWSTRHQQACSTRCGDGYKRVIYECTKYSYTERSMEPMDEDICRRYVGERPKDVVSCIGDCTGTGWVYGNWDEVNLQSFFYFLFNMLIDRFSVITIMVVFVNDQLNVAMHRIYRQYPIIVHRSLFSTLNGVLKHLVINHDGILLLGLMYVYNRFSLLTRSPFFHSVIVCLNDADEVSLVFVWVDPSMSEIAYMNLNPMKLSPAMMNVIPRTGKHINGNQLVDD